MAALAAAAIADALTRAFDRAEPRPPSPPAHPRADEALPPRFAIPVAVRRLGGTLWWTRNGCVEAGVDVASGDAEPVSRRDCRLWPAPDGTGPVVVFGRPGDLFADRRIALFGRDVPLPAGVRLPSGSLPAAWRADGSAFAVCFATPAEPVVRVVPSTGRWTTLAGACYPAWLPDGRLAVARSRPAAIMAGGETLLGQEALAGLVGRRGAPRVRALAAGGGRVAAVVVADRRDGPSPAALVVFTPYGPVDLALDLPRGAVPTAVGLSPGGDAVWYHDAARGDVVLHSLLDGERIPPHGARALSWSPDGSMVAAAQRRRIVFWTWPAAREAGAVPVHAQDVSWTLPAPPAPAAG